MEELSTDEIVGKRIRELRILEHLTQKQLADELSIHEKHLSKIENGKKSITTRMLDQLCVLFKKPRTYFVSLDNVKNASTKDVINEIMVDIKSADKNDILLIHTIVKDIVNKPWMNH